MVYLWNSILEDFYKATGIEITVRFIYSANRNDSMEHVYDELLTAISLQKTLSPYFVGFDLVDEEDRYHTLLYYIDDFLRAETVAHDSGVSLRFFFHAGESDWSDQSNLADAILLNSTRIGHAFALREHPQLMHIVHDQEIALEICPISNQMLRLVKDLRNHPAVTYLHHGLPVVLASDDPTVFNNDGLSYDFYVAFMSWQLEIQGLKQLAMNSLAYSALENDLKSRVIDQWKQDWSEWIKWVVQKSV